MFYIISFILHLFEATIGIYITYKLLDRKLTFKIAIIMGAVLAVYWNYCDTLGSGLIRNLLLYNMLLVFMICINSRANILKVLISVFVSLNISIMIEYSVPALITIILNIPIQSLTDHLFIYSVSFLVCFTFNCAFYFILKKYNISLFDSNKNFLSVDRTFSQDSNILTRAKEISNDFNLLIIIIIIQMSLTTHYFYAKEFYIGTYPVENTYILEPSTVFLGIIILILNITTLFIANKLEKDREEKYQNKIKKIEYVQIEKENSIIRQYKHDLNNHFMLLCGLVEEKKYDDVYNYLVKYHEDINSKTILVETGLDELDVLLYSKINRAQGNNIKIDYKCSANIQCNKEHIVDFISIISNLLDNAIEASEKSEKKFIGIYINEGIVRYFFTIKNTFAGNTIEEPNVILQEGFSTKGSDRGLGLRIVNRLVKKYDGDIEFNNSEDFFEIKVILPKHELEKY